MSLHEAYSLAHTAKCRLNIEASRPDRNLRFVVGHLMHYESLRLRIVEIEHDASKSHHRAGSAVAFKGTGRVGVDDRLQHRGSSGQLGGRKSPPPRTHADEDEDDNSSDDDDYPDDFMDEDEIEVLGLTRFPSGSSRLPSQSHPKHSTMPDLEPDEDGDEDDSDEEDPPRSPQAPDEAMLQNAMKGEDSKLMASLTLYDRLRQCPCHGNQGAVETFERMWELPDDAEDGDRKKGRERVTRAVAQVA